MLIENSARLDTQQRFSGHRTRNIWGANELKPRQKQQKQKQKQHARSLRHSEKTGAVQAYSQRRRHSAGQIERMRYHEATLEQEAQTHAIRNWHQAIKNIYAPPWHPVDESDCNPEACRSREQLHEWLNGLQRLKQKTRKIVAACPETQCPWEQGWREKVRAVAATLGARRCPLADHCSVKRCFKSRIQSAAMEHEFTRPSMRSTRKSAHAWRSGRETPCGRAPNALWPLGLVV